MRNVKIRKVEVFPIAVPIHKFADARESINSSNSVVVKVFADDGHVGIGEACAWEPSFYGETLETVQSAILNYITPRIIGKNPLNINRIMAIVDRSLAKSSGAKEGIDLALYDLAGKILNIPVYALLGGCYRDKIPVASELGIDTAEVMAKNAQDFIELGIYVIKVKGSDDIKEDIQKVKAVRDAVGTRASLRLDPNSAWTTHGTIMAMKELDDCNLEYLEQPVNPLDLDGLARIRKYINTPLMADESIWTPQDVIELARREAVDIINIKLAKTGGIYMAKKVEAAAEAAGLPWTIGNETVPGFTVAAKLHLAASMKDLPYACEFTELSLYQESIIKPKVEIEDGYLSVPHGPGLGYELDEDVLMKYSVGIQ